MLRFTLRTELLLPEALIKIIYSGAALIAYYNPYIFSKLITSDRNFTSNYLTLILYSDIASYNSRLTDCNIIVDSSLIGIRRRRAG